MMMEALEGFELPSQPTFHGRRKGRPPGVGLGSTRLEENRNSSKEGRGQGVGARVLELRLEAGMIQEGLAKLSQLSTSYISRLESGEVNPTVDALTRVAQVFGLTLDGLISRDPEKRAADIDPWLAALNSRLKGQKLSARAKRLIDVIIEEESKDQKEEEGN